MSFILKLFASRLTPYILIAIAMVSSFMAWQISKAKQAQLQAAIVMRDAAQAEVRRLLEVVSGKDVVIEELEAELLDWQTKAAASVLANQEAGARAHEFQSQLNVARTRIRALSETDRAKPNCEALLDVDLAAVCSGRAAGLRQWRADGHHERTSDPRPNPSRPAD